MLDSLESQFRHNQFTVTSHLTGPTCPVLIDPEAAEQALENLLSNAMKYSPRPPRDRGRSRPRRRPLASSESPTAASASRARLQRSIFRKFFRIQTDAGTGPQGTGLGLAIVDHVMRGHGGFVRVDSEPGRGSTFTLHFPLYAGETRR